MKLYEINEAIDALLDALTVDPNTGEAPADIDDIVSRLDELTMKKQNVLEYLAKKVLNLRAEMSALEIEIDRLEDRRDSLKINIDSIMRVLDRECKGEKTDLGVATVKYTKSQETVVDDETVAVRFLMDGNYEDTVKVTEPQYKVIKANVKKLINSGVKVPGCHVEDKSNCSLK